MDTYFSTLLTFTVTMAGALYGAYEAIQTEWFKKRGLNQLRLDPVATQAAWTRFCFGIPGLFLIFLSACSVLGVIAAVHHPHYDPTLEKHLSQIFLWLGRDDQIGKLITLSSMWFLCVASTMVFPVIFLAKAHHDRSDMISLERGMARSLRS